MLAGLLLGYAAFAVPPLPGYGPSSKFVLGNFLLAIGAVYAFLYAWVYRVILADDAITVVSIFKMRSSRILLSRAEIAGVVRLPSTNPRILAFVPKSAEGETAYVHLRFVHTDEIFHQWCATLPDLKPKDSDVPHCS